MKKDRVLVTGSGGFVGQHLVNYLAEHGYEVLASSRSVLKFSHPNITNIQVQDLTTDFDWRPLLSRCDTVVHLAGLAHQSADDRLYDLVNVKAVESLTRSAEACNLKHMVYTSSIAAQSGSYSDVNLTEADTPKPSNSYGRSKLSAEIIVRAATVPFTILRPVVMYGLQEKGNFALMRKCARLPMPLPFGSLRAPRSVLSVTNFSSAVDFVLTNNRSIGETFIVSDPKTVSVAEMLTVYRTALGKRANLVQVPEKWIETALRYLGQQAMWERVGCPLLAPPTKLMQMGWKPEQSVFSLTG